jgi:hypothetical protein
VSLPSAAAACWRAYLGALKAPTFTQTGLLPAVLLCLGLAAIAGEIGLAAIIHHRRASGRDGRCRN